MKINIYTRRKNIHYIDRERKRERERDSFGGERQLLNQRRDAHNRLQIQNTTVAEDPYHAGDNLLATICWRLLVSGLFVSVYASHESKKNKRNCINIRMHDFIYEMKI